MGIGGARPARFRRERVLIVGCGDVGLRCLRALGAAASPGADFASAASRSPRVTVYALTSSPERVPALRAAGAIALLGNLDRPHSVQRLAGIATRVIHLAPPPNEGLRDWRVDPRSRALAAALARRAAPRSLVYGSTSGVYGDCAGAWVDETRPLAAATPRATRRVDAEAVLSAYGRRSGARVTALRIPGIYAHDREGGTPRERLQRGTPVLRREDDVYTNHIQADDLARAVLRALWMAPGRRAYNVCDDSALLMGDYFDLAADLYGLPRPERVPREQARERLSLMVMSFMSESRRLSNARLRRELRWRPYYPQVRDGLLAGSRASPSAAAHRGPGLAPG